MNRRRIRIWEVEPCGKCGAIRGERCMNKWSVPLKRQHKVTYGCPRCCAQLGLCRCGGQLMHLKGLFPEHHPAWIPADLLPAVGATAEDQRRSIL